MDHNPSGNTFRRFATMMCDMYEAVYEADVLKDKMYQWKNTLGELTFPDKRGGYLEFVRKVSEAYIHPEHRQEYLDWMSREAILAAQERGERKRELETLVHRGQESYRWFSVQMLVVEKTEDSLEILLLAKDIQEKRQEELERQKAVLEALQLMRAVNSAYDMLISVNLTQNSYYMVGYDRFLNHSAEEQGVFDDLITVGSTTIPEHQREQFIRAFSRESLLKAHQEGKRSVYLEHQQYSDDGKLHWVSTHVMFTENPYNDDILEVTLSRCIDKIREEEERNKKVLRDALYLAEQANDAKTEFLSRMSHDIRTPMNAIVGMTAIAQANLKDPDKVRDCLEKIDISSKYLLNLISDILDLSRIESGKMLIAAEPFDFRAMVDEIVTMINAQASGKNQAFTVHISDRIDPIYIGDALRLRQIVINLLNNASKYTQNGGAFSLTIEPVQITETRAQLRFQVKDNGEGIDSKLLEKIFDPFFQAGHADKRSGSGLGLAITQNLVHLMNGSVSVESECGKGSCFTVDLPLKRAAKEADFPEPGTPRLQKEAQKVQEFEDIPKGSKKQEPSAMFCGERVLLVEDQELNQEIAATILEMHNLSVDIASNGEEGVKMFQASPLYGYAAILMDIQMPVMNGYDAAKAIRQLVREDAKTIPIYALTADAFASDVAKSAACGMNGHFAKPIDFDHLTTVLKDAFSA